MPPSGSVDQRGCGQSMDMRRETARSSLSRWPDEEAAAASVGMWERGMGIAV